MADYAISNVPRRVVYAASGVGPYAFTFEILAASDIAVYKASTLLTLTTDYTVTINANGTGSITLVVTAGTSNITIVGSKTIARTTDFTTGGDFFANTLNDELDAQTIFIQQVAETAERGLKAPVTDPTDIAMTLPARDGRKGKVLAFDSVTGNPVAGPALDSVVTVIEQSANINTVADNIADVIIVADNTTNINTVAGVSGNVTTVASNIANVNAVGADLLEPVSEINTVAVDIANVNSVGNNIANVNTVAGNGTNINTVAGISGNVTTVAGISAAVTNVSSISSAVSGVNSNATNINTVAGQISPTNNVSTVAGISANVSTVAGISASVTSVAGNATNINTVAGISGNVTTVATNNANVTTVAGISANVTSVAGNATNINAVAGNATNINAVNANKTNIDTVAGIAANVTTVAGNSANVTIAATNVADINNFADVYQGAKATDPTLRNDGSALQPGDLYFNTADDVMKVREGGAWLAAFVSLSGALIAANNLSDLTNKTTARQNLDLEIGVDVQAYDAQLADVAGLSTADNNFIVGNGTNFVAESGSTARTSLGLGSIATQDSSNVTITGGSINGTAVGASTASTGKFTTLDATGNVNLDGGSFVFNEAGADKDARFEGDTNANLLFLDASADKIGIGTNSPQVLAHIQSTTATTNAVTQALRIDSQSSGTPANGIGVGIEFATETAASNTEIGATIEAITTDVTSTSEDFDLSFKTMAAGATAAERMRVTSTGDFKFNSGYGSVATAYGCRAWVSFNGVGTVSIRASGNVSSLTDNGVGNYTINFTTAMPDANYAPFYCDYSYGNGLTDNLTTSSYKATCLNNSFNNQDTDFIFTGIFR